MWSSEPPGGDAERRGHALLRLSISIHVSFNTALKLPHWASQQVDMEEVRRKRRETHGRGGNRGDEGGFSDVLLLLSAPAGGDSSSALLSVQLVTN